jgi:hypothetical protein
MVVAVWVALASIGSLVFVHLLVRGSRKQEDRAAFLLATAYVLPPAAAAPSPPMQSDEVDEPEPTPDPEALIPRWRRPSLQAARKSHWAPVGDVRQPLRFGAGAAVSSRMVVGFRMVRVADRPDDMEGDELGRLDRGDEVDVFRRHGAFALVRAPDGLEGWVVAATLTESPESPRLQDD